MKKMITLLAVLGMVLALPPAAPAELIAGVTATARSEFDINSGWNRLAVSAVNGFGMVSSEGATGLHTDDAENVGYGWSVSQAGNIAHWFKVDLGATYEVGKMYVWNGFGGGWVGIKTADIWYATTDPGNNTANDEVDFVTTGWTSLTTGQAFQQQTDPGEDFGPTEFIDLNVTARYIVLNISEAHGGINHTSIGELQFFTPPPPAGTVFIVR